MVVDDVDDHRDTVVVGGLDEALEGIRSAIARLDSEEVRRVVAPRDVTGELERGHDLDRTDPEIAEVRQPPSRVIEIATPIVLGSERPHVQLVDDHVVPGRHREVVAGPVEGSRVVDHGVAHRVGHLPGIRVQPRQVAIRGADREPILGARRHTADMCGPGSARAVTIRRKARRRTGPPVERAGHEDRLGMGRPDTECGAVSERDGTHPGLRGWRLYPGAHRRGRLRMTAMARSELATDSAGMFADDDTVGPRGSVAPPIALGSGSG